MRGSASGAMPVPVSDTAIDTKSPSSGSSGLLRSVTFSALSVGNGAFAFTADATGLQTFPAEYKELPLATQAEWGWHAFPNTERFQDKDALDVYDAHGRQVRYLSGQNGPAGKWLRENPHRLSLARVGFALRGRDGSTARTTDLADVEQRLDLWSGTIESRFTLDGRVVRVWTWAHPERDLTPSRRGRSGCPPALTPPTPICAVISYGPRRVPDVSAIGFLRDGLGGLL